MSGPDLAAVAARHPELAWIDAGAVSEPQDPTARERRGWLGLRPDRVVEGDDDRVLDRVDAMRREDPTPLWVGWLTYDLGADVVRGRRPRPRALVGACFRRYSSFASFGPAPGPGGPRWVGHGPAGDRSAQVARTIAGAGRARGPTDDGGDGSGWPFGPLNPGLEPDEYRARVRRAVEWIRRGDTYQVNLSQPFHAAWIDPPSSAAELARRAAHAYVDLRRRAPATMGAFIGAGASGWVLSNSPETLLAAEASDDGWSEARSFPIKGTRPRGRSADEDRALVEALMTSEKDRAEHVMIVDLVRNDLGRVCRPGSVVATRRFELVTLPTVHHLVTEVRGRPRPGVTWAALMRALWPGGSITGAPKRRTVEIIDALEGEPRGIYCGAIAVVHRDGAVVSIPIRTARVDRHGLTLRSGGGIVVDSDPETERLETIAKARAFAAPVRT